jgi:TMEM175 potassium channel family protein
MADRDPALPPSDRVAAFSDGVFAITITLLVLEIERPSFTEPDLAGRLLDNWSQYAAFIVSFVYVGVLWLNHHALFSRIRSVDLALNWINLIVLGTTALLPFSTGVLAGAFGEEAPTSNQAAAVVLYALIALLMSAAWVPLFRHLGRHPELLKDPGDAALLRAQRSRPLVGVVSYAVAGLLGWFVSPYIAIAVFVWMIVYHAITSEGLQSNPLARLLTPGRARTTVEREAESG